MDKVTYAICKKLVEDAGMVDVVELKADVDELYSLLTGKVYLIGETTTPLQDQDTTNPILINGVPTEVEAGNLVIYQEEEFVYDGTKWILLGEMGALGELAYKNSARATYTPAGMVTQPTFTGSKLTMTTIVKPSGTVSRPTFTGMQTTLKPKVTAEGIISKPAINVTQKTKNVNSIADVGTLPTLSTIVTNETLSFAFGRGTLPTKGADTAVVSGVTAALASAPTFTGIQVEGTVTYTPNGSVSQPLFSGIQSNVSVSGTPMGTVSAPTFNGTQTTIVSE
jgi:hypothetical protein